MIDFEFDSNGPCRIDAWIPAVSSNGSAVTWQPSEDIQSMEYHIEECASTIAGQHSSTGSAVAVGSGSSVDPNKMFFLQNKPPKWDEEHKGHVLNFHVSCCCYSDSDSYLAFHHQH